MRCGCVASAGAGAGGSRRSSPSRAAARRRLGGEPVTVREAIRRGDHYSLIVEWIPRARCSIELSGPAASFAVLTATVGLTLFRRQEPRPTNAAVVGGPGGRAVGGFLVAGAGIGLLTGFFGVGGGFIVVPALIFALGFPLPLAVVVVAMNSLVALLVRLVTTGVDWNVAIPFAAAALVGAITGTAVAGRVNARLLGRGLAVLLLGVAVYVGARAVA